MTRARDLSAGLLLAMLLVLPIQASDHLDGPATTKHPLVDLTDLYAFPTPQRPGFLTIILDMYPLVSARGHFSDKVDYILHLRRASVRSGDRVGFEIRDEVAIRCSFVTPHDDAAHRATCRTEGGIGATVGFNQILPAAEVDGMRLFAGRRADPFFFNAGFAVIFSMKGRLEKPRDRNSMRGLNTLSLVLEVELQKLFPGPSPSLIALAAESITRDVPGGPVRRLDRIGRPEITNIALAAHGKETDLRAQYNSDPPFGVSADHAAAYRTKIAQNLRFFDAADRRSDWGESDAHALADLLVDDFLMVDLSKPCDRPAFLEIERSLLAHMPYQACGGRKPHEDVMDVIFGLFVGGVQGRPVRDGVDHPSRPASDQFPYLASPEKAASGKPRSANANSALSTSGSPRGY